jgi:hypothetical protein
MVPERQEHVVEQRHIAQQPRLLKHRPDSQTDGTQGIVRAVIPILAQDEDPARFRRNQSGRKFDQ